MTNEEIIIIQLRNLIKVNNNTDKLDAGYKILKTGIENILDDIVRMNKDRETSLEARIERLERITQQSEL